MLCSICFNEIPAVGDWTSGNNAEPVNFGRCCNKCDNEVVIPARITMMTAKISNDVQMEMVREQAAIMQRAIKIYDDFKATTDHAMSTREGGQ